MPRWIWLWIGVVIVLVAVPPLQIALVPVMLLFVLAYAVGFGWGRPTLSSTRSPDTSLLGGRRRDRPDLQAMGGLVAAMVAVAHLAGFLADGSLLTWLIIAALVGVAAAVGGPLGWLRASVYLLVGLAASFATLAALFVHGCDGAMPSRTAAWLTLVPVAGLLSSRALLGPRLGRPIVPAEEAAALALAVFAVLGLGAVAVAPGGIPVLDEQASVWTPLVLLALLTFIAGLIGLRPRAGADLAAIGLLALTLTFAGYNPPCGPDLTGLLVIGAAFVVGFVATTAVRARA